MKILINSIKLILFLFVLLILLKGGRHLYTFKNTCIEEPNLILNNESTVLFLNTNSPLDDVSTDLIGFLKYVEHSTEEVLNEYNSPLLRNVAKRVKEVRENKKMRREFMTLEMYIKEEKAEAKIEERKSIAIALLNLLDDQTIAEKVNLPLEEVKLLRKEHHL